ncbi:MAG: deoxyribonuclease IV [Planctomycetota bacterium]
MTRTAKQGKGRADHDQHAQSPLQKQRFGAHLSVAGGLERAFDLAVEAGCDCLQIFVKNQRQWAAGPPTEEQVRAFRSAQRRSGVRPVIAHGSYLLNLASPARTIRHRSISALADELERCEALGVAGLVVHPGAHMGEGIDAGIGRIVTALDDVHARTAGFKTPVLLETTAGQGSSVGHEIVHLGRIIDACKAPNRLRVCLDTCHLFAAGYDLRDPNGYERTIAEIADHVGLTSVECIHMNDSKNTCGSRIDRHEHITKGKMGRQAFVNIVNDPRLAAVPKILETPKGEDGRGTDMDRVNLRRLRRMIQA